MPQKTQKMDDVKRPERVTPSATARPILVTNQSTLASDPMMAPTDNNKRDGVLQEAANHTAKTIKPLGSTSDEPAKDDASEPDKAAPVELPIAKEESEVKPVAAAEETATLAAADSKAAASSSEAVADADRDPDAAVSAEEAAAAEAKIQREQELEKLIDSGKYAVPIDAVRRKRSRMNTIFLGFLAVILALALLDILADVGIASLPSSVPHTHLFSAK